MAHPWDEAFDKKVKQGEALERYRELARFVDSLVEAMVHLMRMPDGCSEEYLRGAVMTKTGLSNAEFDELMDDVRHTIRRARSPT